MNRRLVTYVLAVGLLLSGLASSQNGQGVPAPSISDAGVVNGAGFTSGVATQGQIISIFGMNFGLAVEGRAVVPKLFQAEGVPLPASLGGYSVTIAGVAAPLFFVGTTGDPVDGNYPGQINAHVPWELPNSGTWEVIVRRDEQGEDPLVSAAAIVVVGTQAPGLFAIDPRTMQASSQGFGLIINNSDGTLAWPVGSAPGARPARIGETVQIWCTGLGAISASAPPPLTGDNSLDENGNAVLRITDELPLVRIGGIGAKVSFSGLQPQFVGVYQVNVELPFGILTDDAASVEISIGGSESQMGVTMAVKP